MRANWWRVTDAFDAVINTTTSQLVTYFQLPGHLGQRRMYDTTQSDYFCPNMTSNMYRAVSTWHSFLKSISHLNTRATKNFPRIGTVRFCRN